jgi:hypothetical protein
MDMSENNEMRIKQRKEKREKIKNNYRRYPWHRKTRPLGDSTSHWRVYNHRPYQDHQKEYRDRGGIRRSSEREGARAVIRSSRGAPVCSPCSWQRRVAWACWR